MSPTPPDRSESRGAGVTEIPPNEGASCQLCGTWCHRYGHGGKGALCDACRAVVTP